MDADLEPEADEDVAYEAPAVLISRTIEQAAVAYARREKRAYEQIERHKKLGEASSFVDFPEFKSLRIGFNIHETGLNYPVHTSGEQHEDLGVIGKTRKQHEAKVREVATLVYSANVDLLQNANANSWLTLIKDVCSCMGLDGVVTRTQAEIEEVLAIELKLRKVEEWTVPAIREAFDRKKGHTSEEYLEEAVNSIAMTRLIKRIQARYRGIMARREVANQKDSGQPAGEFGNSDLDLDSWAEMSNGERQKVLESRHARWTAWTENTIGWIKKKEEIQAAKLADRSLGLNWVPDGLGVRDLGRVQPSWCFSFIMENGSVRRTSIDAEEFSDAGAGDEEDGGGGTAAAATSASGDDRVTASTRIPQQAFQIVHQLIEFGFHIEHSVSARSDRLHIMIGLPYTYLVEEANTMRIGMRLLNTKGISEFKQELIPRYPQYAYTVAEESADGTSDRQASETCFSSAHRQGLTMFRMKRMAKIYPEVLTRRKGKKAMLGQIKDRISRFARVRNYNVYRMLRAFGVYRDFGPVLFGRRLTDIAKRVQDAPYATTSPPQKKKVLGIQMGSQKNRAQRIAAQKAVSWEELEYVIGVLGAWLGCPNGKREQFVGQFEEFFALHHKPTLARLSSRWGAFRLLTTMTEMGKDLERETKYAHLHPWNREGKQFSPLYMPVDDIRDYFGCEVGMYFSWVAMYTKSLTFASIVGMCSYLYQFLTDITANENPATVYYSVFFSIWSITFLSAWKQREVENAFLWGSEDFQVYERPRPNFKGRHVINPITKRETVEYSNQASRYVKLTMSQLLSFMLCYIVADLAVSATNVKHMQNPLIHETLASIHSSFAVDPNGTAEQYHVVHKVVNWKVVASLLNLCLIVVSGLIYRGVAELLTKWENHRTQTEYQDNLITKQFSFEFINNYFVLFYIAYIEPFKTKDYVLEGIRAGAIAPYANESSLGNVEFQMMIVFTIKTIGKTFVQVMKPRLQNKLRKQKLVRERARVVGQAGCMGVWCSARTNCCCFDADTVEWLDELERDERNVDDEYALEKSDSETIFDNFQEMVTQYGYLALFAPAYHLAPLLAFFKNVYTMREEAVRYCTQLRRPQWQPCESIGSWYTVLNVVGFLAVIVNSTMLCFVGSQLSQYTASEEFVTVMDGMEEGAGGFDFIADFNLTHERIGIWNRIHVQRLWVICVIFEHCVMLLRFTILTVSPSTPPWVVSAREILQFRVDDWEETIRTLTEQGLEMEEIHLEMSKGLIKTKRPELAKEDEAAYMELFKFVATTMEFVEPQLGSHLSAALNKHKSTQHTHHHDHAEGHFDSSENGGAGDDEDWDEDEEFVPGTKQVSAMFKLGVRKTKALERKATGLAQQVGEHLVPGLDGMLASHDDDGGYGGYGGGGGGGDRPSVKITNPMQQQGGGGSGASSSMKFVNPIAQVSKD
eukprot:SAG22_NODE_1324_length_4742_cov_2.192117_1_plen_1423_part_00